MIIETISNPTHETKITYGDLEPGIVFQFEDRVSGDKKPGPKMLKLNNDQSILLAYSTGENAFELSDGSLHYREVVKVWGKLVGLKVQL